MNNLVVEPGTMLYDEYFKRIGWVVGKHDWKDLSDPVDWDIEWSDGKKEYCSIGSLRIYIKDYLRLEESNGKR